VSKHPDKAVTHEVVCNIHTFSQNFPYHTQPSTFFKRSLSTAWICFQFFPEGDCVCSHYLYLLLFLHLVPVILSDLCFVICPSHLNFSFLFLVTLHLLFPWFFSLHSLKCCWFHLFSSAFLFLTVTHYICPVSTLSHCLFVSSSSLEALPGLSFLLAITR